MYFVTSEPVFGELFYDRKEELRLLEEAVRDIKKGLRRFYAIYGLRKVGKTSLLLELIRRVENDSRLITAVFDCSGNVASANIFFEELATHLIDRFLITGGYSGATGILAAAKLDESEWLSTLVKAQNLGIRALTAGIKAVLRIRGKSASDRDAYKTIIDLPHQLHQETGKFFLMVMDEFQACAQLNGFSGVKNSVGEIFAFFRSYWQKQKGVNYFVSGSQIYMLEKIIFAEESPFFQHFNHMTLREFPAAEASRMIDSLFLSSGYALQKSRKESLIQLTNGHPFYLQILGEEICKTSSRKKVDDAAFKEAIQNTLFSSTGRLFLYFQDLFAKCARHSTSAERILVAIANGNQGSAEIARTLNQSTGEIGSLLLRLLSLDVIVKENKRYFFRDPVFARWVQGTRSFWKTKMTPVLVGTAAEKAVAEKLSAEGFSAIYQSKASRGAFDLLAIFNSYKVGLQIKVVAAFPFYVRAEEIAKMIFWGQKLKWTPMLCLYQKATEQVCYYCPDDLKKTGKSYRIDDATGGSDRLLPIFWAAKTRKRSQKPK